jgi:hypothetical protein
MCVNICRAPRVVYEVHVRFCRLAGTAVVSVLGNDFGNCSCVTVMGRMCPYASGCSKSILMNVK